MEDKDIKKEALSNYRSEIKMRSFRDVSGHENRTYMIELDNGEEVVCTICESDNPAEHCMKEVSVNRAVSKRTDINTPEVLYSECESSNIPPFYITRKVEGTNGQDLLENKTENRLNPEERKELTGNIGRMMGQLHKEFIFSQAGELVVEESDINIRNGHDFRTYFSDLLGEEVEKLDSTNFSDIQEEVREAVVEALALIENPPQNSMIHHDIRPDNMILNGTEIEALLDFEHVTSGHPLIDYAHTEILVAEPHLYFDVEKPQVGIGKLREELRKGYQQEVELPENSRKQTEVFKLIEHIRNMNSYESYADSVGMSSKERRENREQHKGRFKEMKDKLNKPENLEIILE
jgi:aminoglycoside phosphotransferase (APT) family kinase protein